MRTETLVKVGGSAAIVGGVLRGITSFGSVGGEIETQSLYLVIDLLLLLGAFAAYGRNHEALGRLGAVAFLAIVIGLLLVRSSRAIPGFDLYPPGALSTAAGWLLLSFEWWRVANGPAFVPVLFASSLASGLVGSIVPSATAPIVVSGLAFGAAMVGVGRQVSSGESAAVTGADSGADR